MLFLWGVCVAGFLAMHLIKRDLLRRDAARIVAGLILVTMLAWLIMLVFWPWGQAHPLTSWFESLKMMSQFPWKGTILAGFIAAIVGSVTPISKIGEMVNIGTLFAFVLVCIAIIIMRRTHPTVPRPFKTPWVPFLPGLGIAFNVALMLGLGLSNWLRLIIWMGIGLAVYFGYSRSRSHFQKR